MVTMSMTTQVIPCTAMESGSFSGTTVEYTKNLTVACEGSSTRITSISQWAHKLKSVAHAFSLVADANNQDADPGEVSLLDKKKWKGLRNQGEGHMSDPVDGGDDPANKNEGYVSPNNGSRCSSSVQYTKLSGKQLKGGGDGDGDGDGDDHQPWEKDVPADGVVRPKVKKKKQNPSGDGELQHVNHEWPAAQAEFGCLSEFGDQERCAEALMKINLCFSVVIKEGKNQPECRLCFLTYSMMLHVCECVQKWCQHCEDAFGIMSYHYQNCQPVNGWVCWMCDTVKAHGPRNKSAFMSVARTLLAKLFNIQLTPLDHEVDDLALGLEKLSLGRTDEPALPVSDHICRPITENASSMERRSSASSGSAVSGYRPSGETISSERRLVSDVPSEIKPRPTPRRPSNLGLKKRESRLQSVPAVERAFRGISSVDYGVETHLSRVTKQWDYFKAEVERGRTLSDCHNGIILTQFQNNVVLSHTYDSDDLASVVSVGHNGQYMEGRQYRVVKFVGGGTSGQCHVVQDMNSFHVFARKKVPLAKFKQNELLLWIRLIHPNIVRVYGAVREGRDISIFMEYYDGGTLHQLIADNRRLSVKQSLIYLEQLLQALVYLKQSKVVNEDVKAENILLSSNNLGLALTDFGCSQYVEDNTSLDLTIGTETHNAPEVYMGSHEFGVDVWAAICVFVHMLSGYHPWQRRFEGRVGTLAFVIVDQSPPEQDIPPGLDEDVESLIHFGWTVDKNKRPTAKELLAHRAFSKLSDPALESITAQSFPLSSHSTQSDSEPTDHDEDGDYDRELSPRKLLEMVLGEGDVGNENQIPLMVQNLPSDDDSDDGGDDDVDDDDKKCEAPLPYSLDVAAIRKKGLSCSLPTPVVEKSVVLAVKPSSMPPLAKLHDDSGIGVSSPQNTGNDPVNVLNECSSGEVKSSLDPLYGSHSLPGDVALKAEDFPVLSVDEAGFGFPLVPHLRTSTPRDNAKHGSTPPSGDNQSRSRVRRDTSRYEAVRRDTSRYEADEVFKKYGSSPPSRDRSTVCRDTSRSETDQVSKHSSSPPSRDGSRVRRNTLQSETEHVALLRELSYAVSEPEQKDIQQLILDHEASMATMFLPQEQQLNRPNTSQSEVDGISQEDLVMVQNLIESNGTLAPPTYEKVYFVDGSDHQLAKVAITSHKLIWKDVINWARPQIFNELGQQFSCVCNGLVVDLDSQVGNATVRVICRPKIASDDWYASDDRIHVEKHSGHFEMDLDDYNF